MSELPRIERDKNIIILNINDINNCFDNFAIAKMNIERNRLKTNEKYETMNLTDFISSIKFVNVFVYSENELMPFCIYDNNDITYLFYFGIQNSTNNAIILKMLVDKLTNKKVNFKEVKLTDLISENEYQPKFPYFMLDGKYFVCES